MDHQDAKDVSDIVQRVHKEMLNRISIHQAPMGPKIAIQAELSKRFGNL